MKTIIIIDKNNSAIVTQVNDDFTTGMIDVYLKVHYGLEKEDQWFIVNCIDIELTGANGCKMPEAINFINR